MGADNQAEKVIARLAREQMAAETAKDGATMQIYKTAVRCKRAADERERQEYYRKWQRRVATQQMGD